MTCVERILATTCLIGVLTMQGPRATSRRLSQGLATGRLPWYALWEVVCGVVYVYRVSLTMSRPPRVF